jgi:hypothetical protein
VEKLPEQSLAKATAFSWPVFTNRILKAGFAILVFGAVLIVLYQLSTLGGIVGPIIIEPWAFLGAGIAIAALTMLGIPILPAAIVGAGFLWVLQTNFF